jgi:hypothetical protein
MYHPEWDRATENSNSSRSGSSRCDHHEWKKEIQIHCIKSVRLKCNTSLRNVRKSEVRRTGAETNNNKAAGCREAAQRNPLCQFQRPISPVNLGENPSSSHSEREKGECSHLFSVGGFDSYHPEESAGLVTIPALVTHEWCNVHSHFRRKNVE